MTDFIIIAIIVIIIGSASFYVYKAKKSGKKCIGCPDSATCSAKSSAGSSCSGNCASCQGCSSYSSAE